MNLPTTIKLNKLALWALVAFTFLVIIYSWNRNTQWGNEGNDEYRHGKKVRLGHLLVAAIHFARKGGEEVVRVRKQADSKLQKVVKGKTLEGAQDVVTQGDYHSHRVMYYGMKKIFPMIRVVSEEHVVEDNTYDVFVPSSFENEYRETQTFFTGEDDEVATDDVLVWIDPLDATQEYTENLVTYVTTMVGVAVKGKSVLGVIHKPFSNETFWAVKDRGVSPLVEKLLKNRRNEVANRLNDNHLEHINIVVSRSHSGSVRNLTEHALKGIDAEVQIHSAAGAGFKILEVIKGSEDVYLHSTRIKKWDLCAGNGIISALGSHMSDLSGQAIDYSKESDTIHDQGVLVYMDLPSNVVELFKEIKSS